MKVGAEDPQNRVTSQERGPPRTNKGKALLLLVNTHSAFGCSLASQIEPQTDLMVCGQAVNACETFLMIEALHPDLAVIDVFMEDPHGVELLIDLQKYYPCLPVIILSIHDEMLYAERALRAGVKGYVMISEPVSYILGAMREVLKGGLAFSHNVTQRLLQRSTQFSVDHTIQPVDRLSKRERQILELIGQGISTHKIGVTLEISIKTVQAHRENIKKKLEIKDGLSLTMFAIHWLERKNTSTQAHSDINCGNNHVDKRCGSKKE